jgi:hypothetical protein
MNEEVTYTVKELQKVKNVAKGLLEIDKRCRDDDLWLMIQGYRKMGFEIYIDYKDLDKMPRPETWKRIRAYYQNKLGLYKSDNPKVIKRRKTRRKVIEHITTLI